MLRPVINYENPPPAALLQALMHFEARCQMQGRLAVAEADVQSFLEEEYPSVADLFEPTHLRPA